MLKSDWLRYIQVEVTEETVGDVAEDAADITENSEELTSAGLALVAEVLENIIKVNSTDEEVYKHRLHSELEYNLLQVFDWNSNMLKLDNINFLLILLDFVFMFLLKIATSLLSLTHTSRTSTEYTIPGPHFRKV